MGNAVVVKKDFRIDLENELFIRGEVTLVEEQIKKPVLVISHGFRGYKDWGFWPYVATWFAERGFYVVHFDFSRVGALNSGADEASVQKLSTVSRELSDLDAVLAHLREHKLPLAEQAETERITLLGHSRAGGSNIIFAAEHSYIGSVIAWNGGPSPRQLPETRTPLLMMMWSITSRDSTQLVFLLLLRFQCLLSKEARIGKLCLRVSDY